MQVELHKGYIDRAKEPQTDETKSKTKAETKASQLAVPEEDVHATGI
jgi:hypothetical protein